MHAERFQQRFKLWPDWIMPPFVFGVLIREDIHHKSFSQSSHCSTPMKHPVAIAPGTDSIKSMAERRSHNLLLRSFGAVESRGNRAVVHDGYAVAHSQNFRKL